MIVTMSVMTDDVLAAEQNQYAREDREHGQASCDRRRDFVIEQRQQSSESQPQTQQKHS